MKKEVFTNHAFLLFCLTTLFIFAQTSQADLSGFTNLKLWFDGSDIQGNGSSVSDGADVNLWADKSGNGINATNYGKTGGVYVADVFNGQGGVYFGNSNDNWLRTEVSSELDFVESTVFMVADFMSSPSHFAMSEGSVRDNEYTIWTNTMGHSFNSAGSAIWPSFTIPDNELYVQTGVWGQGFHDMTMSINGTETYGGEWQFGNGEPDFTAVPRAAFLGQRAEYYDEDFDGLIAEVIVFEGKLTTEQQNEVGWYLTQKYGVETTYTDPVPEPATLSLLALGGLLIRKRR
ncbi:MAG: PEP-CTERM sorting domain-containing protein [Planctomycetes bacterium]|nr:PEP-CTERM sorting domain-containing protein [Planctomycetota bacterium]